MAKKQLKGIVVSNKMADTVVVSVGRIKEHKKYRRRFKIQKKYKADTGNKNYNIGDIILIEECSPISKDKTWRVIKIITESKLIDAEEIENMEPVEKNEETEKKEEKEQPK
jgi:small subunit ribosomal protein S17